MGNEDLTWSVGDEPTAQSSEATKHKLFESQDDVAPEDLEDETLEVEAHTPTKVTLDSRWLWGLLLLAIAAVAAGLRLYDLSRQSLWLDELFTANVVAGGPQLTLGRIMHGDTNPPLYYLLQSLVSWQYGRTEWALRILPAILGVLSVITTYFAGASLFDRKTGAWAAGLAAVSIVAIEYSQEARMYSLMLFGAALVLWALGALIRKPGPINAALLGAAMALLAYSHVYGYVAAPMLLVAIALIPRLRSRIGSSMFITYPALAVLFVPWVFAIPAQVAFVQRQADAGNWWMTQPDDLIGMLVHYIGLYAPGQDVLSGLLFFILLATGFVHASNAVAKEPTEDGKRPAILESDIRWTLLILMTLPVLAGIAVSYYVTPISTIRNTLVGLPAAYLLAVHGAFKFKKPFGMIALAALLVGALVGLPAYYRSDSKGHWKDALKEWGADTATGALAEDWLSASNIDGYRTITYSRRSGDMLWLSDPGNASGLTGQILPDNTPILLSEWLTRYDRVVVMSQTEDSWLFKHMEEEPGWKQAKVAAYSEPYLRVYERAAEAAPVEQ